MGAELSQASLDPVGQLMRLIAEGCQFKNSFREGMDDILHPQLDDHLLNKEGLPPTAGNDLHA